MSIVNPPSISVTPRYKPEHQSRETLMRNKTFYEVIVETGSKRTENASMQKKVDKYRNSQEDFFKKIKSRYPKIRH